MRPLAALCCSFALAACAAGPASASLPEYTLVRLETGPRTEPLTDAESREVFGGHFANMLRLQREGDLLLAGPFGKQKTDPRWRGLFVLATTDHERARQLAETDPGFAAGVFRFAFASFATDAPLAAMAAAELAAHDAAVAAGRTPKPGEGCRNYVWLTADRFADAAAVFAGDPAALLVARLDGGRAMVLLDANDRAAAAALVGPLAERIGPFTLDEWFGTDRLARRTAE
jgi:uncharacterized protein YciI